MEGVEGENNLYGGNRRGTESVWRELKENRICMEGVKEEQNLYGGSRWKTESVWRE